MNTVVIFVFGCLVGICVTAGCYAAGKFLFESFNDLKELKDLEDLEDLLEDKGDEEDGGESEDITD